MTSVNSDRVRFALNADRAGSDQVGQVSCGYRRPDENCSSLVSTSGTLSIMLRHDVWFDPESGILRRGQTIIGLTRRETALLAVLVRAPRHYLRARDLADHLERRNGFPLDDHCIEQSISQLRRKLGESAKRPGLVRNRSGFGYALFPEA